MFKNLLVSLLRGSIFAACLFLSQACLGGSPYSQGPNNTGTAVDDATVGTKAWSNPSNVTIGDNVYSTATVNFPQVTHYLKATNYSFTGIQDDITITGITVVIERQAQCAVGCVADSEIKIVKGGVIGSENKSTGATWPNSGVDVNDSFGGASDLWSETWTPADIMASDFGMVISAIGNGGVGAIAKIDAIRITVNGTRPDGSGWTQMRDWY